MTLEKNHFFHPSFFHKIDISILYINIFGWSGSSPSWMKQGYPECMKPDDFFFQKKVFSTRYDRTLRSSRPEISIRKGVLRNFAKKRLWHRCFPVNFTKFPRTPVLQNTYGSYWTLIKKFFVGFDLIQTFSSKVDLRKFETITETSWGYKKK